MTVCLSAYLMESAVIHGTVSLVREVLFKVNASVEVEIQDLEVVVTANVRWVRMAYYIHTNHHSHSHSHIPINARESIEHLERN